MIVAVVWRVRRHAPKYKPRPGNRRSTPSRRSSVADHVLFCHEPNSRTAAALPSRTASRALVIALADRKPRIGDRSFGLDPGRVLQLVNDVSVPGQR
jgi:hypothetical protein